MVSSSSAGCCAACHHPLPEWRYTCSSFGLHTAAGGRAAFQGSYAGAQGRHGAVGQRSFGSPVGQGCYNYNHVIQGYGGPVIQGGYGYGHPTIHGIYCPPVTPGAGHGATGGSGQSILHNPGRLMTSVARFLLRVAISTAVSGFALHPMFCLGAERA
uniref:Uncharacterized protein n=1 Tax=Setaria italica TaxID=4555 RepID=K4A134_SETIT